MKKILNILDKNFEPKGITLITLVITIVILLILAGVSINVAFSDNGIINKSKETQNEINEQINNDINEIDTLRNLVNKENIQNPHPGDEIKLKTTGKPIGREIQTNTVVAQDAKENQVVVPGGFKISEDSGTSVQQGIVIEDEKGNQFVWIPVSNIDGIKEGETGSTSKKIKKDNGDEVEITLGRYTFKRKQNVTTGLYEDGTPTLRQSGLEYAKTTLSNVTDGSVETKYLIGSYYYELSDKNKISNEKADTTGTNTTVNDLEAFITKTQENRGYYIARYEASYGNGYNSLGTTTAEKYGNAKPLSKPSTSNNVDGMNYETGTLWNYITQPQAAIVSKNMYSGNSYIESDLINSYAWDTAIVYI